MTDIPPESATTPLLSAQGVARRDRMLGDLVSRMREVHRARRVRRRVAMVAAPMLLIAAIATIARWPGSRPTTSRDGTTVAHGSAPAPAAIISVVRSSDDSLVRYRAEPGGESDMIVMTDAELLDALAGMNRPAGLVRTNGRVHLTRDVIDPDPSEIRNSS